MNRREFMNRLEQLLQGITEEERRDALQFYEDYFEDAGPENEQEVIRNLGSPEDVAKSILNEQQASGEYNYQQNSSGYNYQQASNGYQYQQNPGVNNCEPQNYQNPKNRERNWIILIILIVTAPITIPVAFSVICAVFSFFIGIAGCVIGFFAAALGLFIGAVVLFSTGLPGFALLCLGLGFGFLCVTFLLIPLIGWLCSTAVPAIYMWTKNGIMKLMQKGGSNA